MIKLFICMDWEGAYIPNPVFTCPKITKPKLHQRKH